MSSLRASLLYGLALSAAVALSCAPSSGSPDRPATGDSPPPSPVGRPAPTAPRAVMPDGTGVTLELAMTPEEIGQGLMFRPSLPDDRGMLFMFEVERVPSFWMKNTMIPLDLVFLASDGVVADIIENAQPCANEPCPQYIPSAPARAVLEVASGFAARHGLAVGDEIVFERVPGYPVDD